MGIPSQCIRGKNIFRPNPQYLGNVLLKVNTKIGGRNTELSTDLPLLREKTIIFGADVTHPGPGASYGGRTPPSIVAVSG